MQQPLEDKKIYTETLIKSYNSNLGSLCHYYTQIESRMLEIMVIMKHHFDKPSEGKLIEIMKAYEVDKMRKPLSSKMKLVFAFIEKFNPDLNKKYKSTYDDCNYLKTTRDKLAHRHMVFDGNMMNNDGNIVIKLRQIGYFGEQEEYMIEELYNLIINAPVIVKSLDELLKELRVALNGDLPSLE
jgi:hypothetical protein